MAAKIISCRAWVAALSLILAAVAADAQSSSPQCAREVAIPAHLQDGDEFNIPIQQLIDYGRQLFNAKFTVQEGAGRPMTKGTGAPISDPSSPLLFPRNFDRLSSPEANACSGCHNAPVIGAGGDRVTEVFVLAQRFDHLTLDPLKPLVRALSRSECRLPDWPIPLRFWFLPARRSRAKGGGCLSLACFSQHFNVQPLTSARITPATARHLAGA